MLFTNLEFCSIICAKIVWRFVMNEFFGIGGYQRPVEGFLSWQHILFVTTFIIAITLLAIYLGRKNKGKSYEETNKVIIWTAIILDSIEIIRIIIASIVTENPERWLYELPLFLCSIQLIAIPFAAFSKGRVKEAALDFVFIFRYAWRGARYLRRIAEL